MSDIRPSDELPIGGGKASVPPQTLPARDSLKPSTKLDGSNQTSFEKSEFADSPRAVVDFEIEKLPIAGGAAFLEDLEACIATIVYDVVDRDRRIFAVVQRLDPFDSARRLVRALKGTMYRRAFDCRSIGYKSIDEFREAACRALDRGAVGGAREAVFIEEIGTDEDGMILSSLLSREPTAATLDLMSWLGHRHSRLVIVIAAAPHDRIAKIFQTYPSAYRLPWTETWILHLERHYDFTFDELRDAHFERISTLTNAETPDGLAREGTLFRTLGRLTNPALQQQDEVDDFISLGIAIDRAIEQSANAKALEKNGRQILDNLFGSFRGPDPDDGKARSPKPTDSVASVILALAVLMNKAAERTVIELAQALLPDGEAISRFHSERMIERVQRQNKTGWYQSRDPEPLPTWLDVFNEDPTIFIVNAGLTLSPEGTFIPNNDLAPIDLRGFLRSRPAFLRQLLGRIITRRLLFVLPIGLVHPLLDLLAELHAMDESLLPVTDLVAALAGFTSGRPDLGVTGQIADDVARARVKWLIQDQDRPDEPAILSFFTNLAKDVRQIGDFRLLAMARVFVPQPSRIQVTTRTDVGDFTTEINNPHEEEDARDRLDRLVLYATAIDGDLYFPAAARLRQLIVWFSVHPKCKPATIDEIIENLAMQVSSKSLWLVFAYLLLYGPQPNRTMLGTWTLRPFKDASAMTFAEHFRDLRNILDGLIRGAMAEAPSSLVPYHHWADAIHSAACEAQSGDAMMSIATFMDDFISNFEIPWSRRSLDRASDALPVLSTQFFAGHPESVPSNLIERLFARTADERLAAIANLQTIGREPPFVVTADQIIGRMRDIFFIITDEVDAAEALARRLNDERIEEIVWSAITTSLGFPICHTSFECATLVMDRAACLAGDWRRAPVTLLDLYAPAVLLNWRFRAMPPQPMILGSAEDIRFRAGLDGLKKAAGKQLPQIVRAFKALESAEANFVDHLRYMRCDRTAERHERRRQIIRNITKFFVPPVLMSI